MSRRTACRQVNALTFYVIHNSKFHAAKQPLFFLINFSVERIRPLWYKERPFCFPAKWNGRPPPSRAFRLTALSVDVGLPETCPARCAADKEV
jgi:hypothetical protein